MEILKIVAIGIITTIAVLIVKQTKPEIAVLVGLAGSLLIFFELVNLISSIFSVFNSVIVKTGVSNDLFSILLKIIGVGYLTEFSASICADSGNSSIADKIMLGGKVLIMVLSFPIFTSILEIVLGLLWNVFTKKKFIKKERKLSPSI